MGTEAQEGSRLDEARARISGRIQERQSAVRDAIRADLGLLACIEALKPFGVKVVGYWSDTVSYGNKADFSGLPWTPYKYIPPKRVRQPRP